LSPKKLTDEFGYSLDLVDGLLAVGAPGAKLEPPLVNENGQSIDAAGTAYTVNIRDSNATLTQHPLTISTTAEAGGYRSFPKTAGMDVKLMGNPPEVLLVSDPYQDVFPDDKLFWLNKTAAKAKYEKKGKGQQFEKMISKEAFDPWPSDLAPSQCSFPVVREVGAVYAIDLGTPSSITRFSTGDKLETGSRFGQHMAVNENRFVVSSLSTNAVLYEKTDSGFKQEELMPIQTAPHAGPVYIGDPQAKEVTVTSSTQVHIFQLEQALEHDRIATAILDLKKSNGQQIINPTPSPTAPAIEDEDCQKIWNNEQITSGFKAWGADLSGRQSKATSTKALANGNTVTFEYFRRMKSVQCNAHRCLFYKKGDKASRSVGLLSKNMVCAKVDNYNGTGCCVTKVLTDVHNLDSNRVDYETALQLW
jgi:hypothetical protein